MIGCCEKEVRDCSLKCYWVLYFSNNVGGFYSRCGLLGGRKRTMNVVAAPGGYVMAAVFNGFNRPGGGVMLIMLFNTDLIKNIH